MVTTDHYPADAWQRRIDEWTPAVSATSWADTLHKFATMQAAGQEPDFCLYVAVDEADTPVGLIHGYAQTDATTVASKIGEIGARYIKPSAQWRSPGRHHPRRGNVSYRYRPEPTAHRRPCGQRDARRFYEAIGGQVVAERTYGEDGVQLLELVYGWPDIALL
ncbi:MAG: hypothetical protein R2932_34565 [Caldilineaceae bacterium]